MKMTQRRRVLVALSAMAIPQSLLLRANKVIA